MFENQVKFLSGYKSNMQCKKGLQEKDCSICTCNHLKCPEFAIPAYFKPVTLSEEIFSCDYCIS